MDMLRQCRMPDILGQQLMVRTFAAASRYRVSFFKLIKDLRRQTGVNNVRGVGRDDLRRILSASMPLSAKAENVLIEFIRARSAQAVHGN
jgi:hypothetical protein